MRPSRVLNKLRAGQTVCCTKFNLTDPRATELAAMCGFDCVWLDMEHTPSDWNTIETIDANTTYPDGEDIVLQQVLGDKVSARYTFTSFLNIGSIGEEVRQLQTKLKTLGYFTYEYITGYYGPITAQAVKDFQKANNVEVVGYVGPKTRFALNSD